MQLSLIVIVAVTVPLVTLLLLPSLCSYFSVDSKKSHKDSGNSNDIHNGVNAMFRIAANPQGPGPGEILSGFNDWNALGYIATSHQVSAAQSFKVPNEQTIDNVRQSRLALLEGIDNAIQRLIKSEQKTLTEMPKGMFDTTHIAQLLKTDQLDAAIKELTILKAQVIKVFGQEGSRKRSYTTDSELDRSIKIPIILVSSSLRSYPHFHVCFKPTEEAFQSGIIPSSTSK